MDQNLERENQRKKKTKQNALNNRQGQRRETILTSSHGKDGNRVELASKKK